MKKLFWQWIAHALVIVLFAGVLILALMPDIFLNASQVQKKVRFISECNQMQISDTRICVIFDKETKIEFVVVINSSGQLLLLSETPDF